MPNPPRQIWCQHTSVDLNRAPGSSAPIFPIVNILWAPQLTPIGMPMLQHVRTDAAYLTVITSPTLISTRPSERYIFQFGSRHHQWSPQIAVNGVRWPHRNILVNMHDSPWSWGVRSSCSWCKYPMFDVSSQHGHFCIPWATSACVVLDTLENFVVNIGETFLP